MGVGIVIKMIFGFFVMFEGGKVVMFKRSVWLYIEEDEMEK